MVNYLGVKSEHNKHNEKRKRNIIQMINKPTTLKCGGEVNGEGQRNDEKFEKS